MKAVWIAVLIVLAPFAASAQEGTQDDMLNKEWVQGPVTPPFESRYSYIEIYHEGTQDKTPPALWIGTDEDAPPQPEGLNWGTFPTPFYVMNTRRVVMSDATYAKAIALTNALKCPDRVSYDWSEITISVYSAGRLQSYCSLEYEAALGYMTSLRALKDPGAGDSAIDTLARFVGYPEDWHHPNKPRPRGWMKLSRTGSGNPSAPEIWLGPQDQLPALGPHDGKVVRLVLSDKQYQIMEIAHRHEMCWNDPRGIVYDGELAIDENGQQSGCLYYGPEACYFLHLLYSLSLPDDKIEGIESVRGLADTVDCETEPWPEIGS